MRFTIFAFNFIISDMPYLIKLKEIILDALFPPNCLNCESPLNSEEKNDGVCHLCLSRISVHATLFCSACQARLPENKKVCHKNSKYLLGAVTNYEDIIRTLIHRFKYGRWQRISGVINDLIDKYLKNLNLKLNRNYIVVPIPLHENKKAERGFNQSEIIARHVAEKLNLPLKTDKLIRVRETQSQTAMRGWEERRNNLKGSFDISSPEQIKSKNIILVDDIYTSGATIGEAAETLKKAGARKIIAFVIAKTK